MDIAIDMTQSETMQEALWKIQRVAPSDLGVVINGEQGTGKEWAAHLIHQLSSRAKGPFCPIDFAAMAPENIEKELFGYEAITWNGIDIKRSAFEEAGGGTLLLNELPAVPLAVQMKIARAIEYQQFRRICGERDLSINARIIATMSENPETLQSRGHLNKDLYYRIGAITIELPPLRNRRKDIPMLIEKFLQELHTRYGSSVERISQEALSICLAYDWPGNVRHLKNAIEYASIMCGTETIRPEHLPFYLQGDKQRGRDHDQQG